MSSHSSKAPPSKVDNSKVCIGCGAIAPPAVVVNGRKSVAAGYFFRRFMKKAKHRTLHKRLHAFVDRR